MLTVKHVETTGHESGHPAESFSFQPVHAGGLNSPALFFAFGVPGPDAGARKDNTLTYDCGRIYVMNDNGKTVAAYDLGDHAPVGPGSTPGK